jgi:hypothetical protein
MSLSALVRMGIGPMPSRMACAFKMSDSVVMSIFQLLPCGVFLPTLAAIIPLLVKSCRPIRTAVTITFAGSDNRRFPLPRIGRVGARLATLMPFAWRDKSAHITLPA